MRRESQIPGVILAFLVLLAGCGKLEPAPYRDGLRLKYQTTVGGPMGLESGFSIQVRISQVEGEKLKAAFTMAGSSPGTKALMDSSGPMEVLVDKYGRLDKGTPLSLIGPDEPPIWAPMSRMKPGGRSGRAVSIRNSTGKGGRSGSLTPTFRSGAQTGTTRPRPGSWSEPPSRAWARARARCLWRRMRRGCRDGGSGERLPTFCEPQRDKDVMAAWPDDNHSAW